MHMFHFISSQNQLIPSYGNKGTNLLYQLPPHNDVLLTNECSDCEYNWLPQQISKFWILSKVICVWQDIVTIFVSRHWIKPTIEWMIQNMWHCLSCERIFKNINHFYKYNNDTHLEANLVSKRATVVYDINERGKITDDVFNELPQLQVEFEFRKQHKSRMIDSILR